MARSKAGGRMAATSRASSQIGTVIDEKLLAYLAMQEREVPRLV
jgi:hypothetical protein